MKKNKLQDKFFEELSKIPIVQIACEKTGLSRNSIYRWRKEDPTFLEEMEKALSLGVAFVNDMSESQLLSMIKEKNYSAISFWLRHRNDNYKNKIEVTATIGQTQKDLTSEQRANMEEALLYAELPIINKTVNINKNETPKE